MTLFEIVYNFFISLGLSQYLSNIFTYLFFAFIYLLLILFIYFGARAFVNRLFGERFYCLFYDDIYYFYTFTEDKIGSKRFCKKHLFNYKYVLYFGSKDSMLEFINQLGLLPIKSKNKKG